MQRQIMFAAAGLLLVGLATGCRTNQQQCAAPNYAPACQTPGYAAPAATYAPAQPGYTTVVPATPTYVAPPVQSYPAGS